MAGKLSSVYGKKPNWPGRATTNYLISLIDRHAKTGQSSRRTYIVTYAPRRFSDCRKLYYQERYKQQQAERKNSLAGPFFIK